MPTIQADSAADPPVTHLCLSHNKIARLALPPALFEGLEELHLNHNQLTRTDLLYGSLALEQLRCLDLSHNQLKDVSPLVMGIVQGKLPRLQRLHLHYNRIVFFPIQATQSAPAIHTNDGAKTIFHTSGLQTITLEGNPLLLSSALSSDLTEQQRQQLELPPLDAPVTLTLPTLGALCWLAVQRGSASSDDTSMSSPPRKTLPIAERLLAEGLAEARTCTMCCLPFIGAPVVSLRTHWKGPLLGSTGHLEIPPTAANVMPVVAVVGGDACSIACAHRLLAHYDAAAATSAPSGDAHQE